MVIFYKDRTSWLALFSTSPWLLPPKMVMQNNNLGRGKEWVLKLLRGSSKDNCCLQGHQWNCLLWTLIGYVYFEGRLSVPKLLGRRVNPSRAGTVTSTSLIPTVWDPRNVLHIVESSISQWMAALNSIFFLLYLEVPFLLPHKPVFQSSPPPQSFQSP